MHVPNFNNIEKTLFRLRNLFLTVTEKIAQFTPWFPQYRNCKPWNNHIPWERIGSIVDW